MKISRPDLAVALDAHATLGEGAIWDERTSTLLWVDIFGKRVHRFHPDSGNDRSVLLPSLVGTVVPTEHDDEMMLAVQEGFCRLRFSDETLSSITTPEGHDPNRLRFNDGKCDPAGRFWAGTMGLKVEPEWGSLYSLDADHRIVRHVTGVSISNGIVWDAAAKTMYYIDTPPRTLDAFDYDLASGQISNRRRVLTFSPELGLPDGMTIDTDGFLLIAMWDGAAILRVDARTSQIVEKFPLPTDRITSCAFGGPNLDTLYVTSARIDLPPEKRAQQPLAGALFAFQPGGRGLPAFRYQG